MGLVRRGQDEELQQRPAEVVSGTPVHMPASCYKCNSRLRNASIFRHFPAMPTTWEAMVPDAGCDQQHSTIGNIPQFAVLFESRQFYLRTPVLYPLQGREILRTRTATGCAAEELIRHATFA